MKANWEKAIAEKSIVTWAYRNRKIRTGGSWQPYTLQDYPFLQKIFHALQNPDTDKVVLQKATQIGATELAVTSAFYFLDIKAENVLYMLPNQGQLGDFAHSRLDKTIEKSPYLNALFADISNVGLKVSSRGSLYLRGANSASGLEEFPAGYVIRDELSRMDQENANLAFKRLGSSENAWKLDLGHPTFEGCAISSEFADSSRHEWVYECPNCGEIQKIDFFYNFYNRDNELGCRSCGENWIKTKVIKDGKWSAQGDEDNPVKGFHLSRILSPVETLENLAREYEDAKAEGDYKLAQFHRTALGEPFSAEGDKINQKTVREVMTGPDMDQVKAEGTVLGVDTGKPLYWAVLDGNQVLAVGRAAKFDYLKSVISKYNVETCLFDAMPEPHAVESFIDDLPPKVRGYMVRTKGSGDIGPPKVKKNQNEVKAHAVWMFDHLFQKIHDGDLVLPGDLPAEAVEHLTNPVRVIEEDAKGNPKPSYEKGTCHFADAIKFGLIGTSDKSGVKKKQARVFGKSNKSKKGIVPAGREIRVRKSGIFG